MGKCEDIKMDERHEPQRVNIMHLDTAENKSQPNTNIHPTLGVKSIKYNKNRFILIIVHNLIS